jgi:hypothetical protein
MIIIWIPVVVARMDLVTWGSECRIRGPSLTESMAEYWAQMPALEASVHFHKAQRHAWPGAYPGGGRQHETNSFARSGTSPVQFEGKNARKLDGTKANAAVNRFSLVLVLDPGVECCILHTRTCPICWSGAGVGSTEWINISTQEVGNGAVRIENASYSVESGIGFVDHCMRFR